MKVRNHAYLIFGIHRFSDRLLEQEDFNPELFADQMLDLLWTGFATENDPIYSSFVRAAS
jgi:hypothetical protein